MNVNDLQVGQWYWFDHRIEGQTGRRFTGRAKILSIGGPNTVASDVIFSTGTLDKRILEASDFVGPMSEQDIPWTTGQKFTFVVEKMLLYVFVSVAIYKMFVLEF